MVGERTVFRDVGKLSFDYVPEKLVHREKEMGFLRTLFKPVLSGISQNVLVTGSVGTGKTAAAKRFCMDFQEAAGREGKALDFTIVNCRQNNTTSAAMLRILNHFEPHFPERGFAVPEMSRSLRKDIEKRKTHLIVVLDEAEVLLKKSGSDLIYNLTRFDEEGLTAKSSVSLILISPKFAFDYLDSASLSTFKRSNRLEFSRYSEEQLHDILDARVGLAFHPGTVEEDSILLIASIASEWGDARYAIELLEKAGMLADEEKKEQVGAEEVRRAKAETYSTVTEEKIESLDRSKLLVLLGVARAIKGKASIGTSDAEKDYAIACEEYGVERLGHTRFWDDLKELDALGLIELKSTKGGSLGKTSTISLTESPAKLLRERIEGMLDRMGKR